MQSMKARQGIAVAAAALCIAACVLTGCPSGRTRDLHSRYDAYEWKMLVPMLTEILAFQTLAGNSEGHAAQEKWLVAKARELGFACRVEGPMTEIDLPGPEGAPVLGLVVHGDVTAVDERAWSSPPFTPVVKDGEIFGRGSADDKGPLVQALLAMKTIAESGARRTHTIRLLVGSDEESGATDVKTYLETHSPPTLSLVLDSAFPVVVGEKAWNALTVTAPLAEREPARERSPRSWFVERLTAGVFTSIVPDRAECALRWEQGPPVWKPLVDRLRSRPLPEGTRLEVQEEGAGLIVLVHGKSAHAGVNITGGRNALVALANLLDGELPDGGASDLLAFAKLAGEDLHGTGLGITGSDPIFGRYDVNVATILPAKDGAGHSLTINLRRTPPWTGPQLKAHLDGVVAAFNAGRGASLVPSGFYDDEPFSVNPDSRLVKRLLAAFEKAAGQKAPPAISGGGTYAKRLPNAVAFGMWFPGKPYPGHDVDEHVPIADLHRGVHVLLEALSDLACGDPMRDPLRP